MPIINQVVKGSGGSAPERYISVNESNNKLVSDTATVFPLPNTVSDISPFLLGGAYAGNSSISSIVIGGNNINLTGENCMNQCFKGSSISSLDFSSLVSVSGTYALNNLCFSCRSLTSVNLSGLKVLSYAQNAFSGCSSLSSVNMASLEVISAAAGNFLSETALTSYEFDKLVYVGSYSASSFFSQCTSLTNVKFYSLNRVAMSGINSMFFRCTSLTDVYFYALRTVDNANSFSNILQLDTNVTMHFPSNLDPQGGSTVISSLQGYPTFGGTNTVLAFDLPATVILTGANTTEYERNPKYDTATALAWRVKDTGTAPNLTIDWTPFYTSGTTDPQVNDTIYSDSACTTAVTTISAIA